METFKEMQFTVEKDSVLCDHFEKLDTKVKAAFTRAYNLASHTSQVPHAENCSRELFKRIGGWG